MSVAFTLAPTQIRRLTTWLAKRFKRGVHTASLALGENPSVPEKIPRRFEAGTSAETLISRRVVDIRTLHVTPC
jgi:hypothetical protein